MKRVLVIPDGAADEPQSVLGNRTPLQAAATPAMDAVAREGLVGQVDHIPAGMPSGSDVGTMSLFGEDPAARHTGRAPIEAAAQGIELGPNDWAVRCNLVEVIDGVMKSFTAHQIDSAVAADLLHRLQSELPGDGPWRYVPGVSYRNLLLYRGDEGDPPFDETTATTPPHDITDQAIAPHLPGGRGGERLRELMDRSRANFAATDSAATQVWLWGQGNRPQLPAFAEKYGARGAVITAVDLLRGLGKLLGWDVIEVEGATGYLDTDYAAKGRAAIAALQTYDFVCVHVEATDEASHEGDAAAKVQALEEIDTKIVGPLRKHLEASGQPFRLLVCPDHPTFLRTKTHSHGYVPFAVCGEGIATDAATTYDEVAATGGLTIDAGHTLMDRLYGSF